MRALLFGKSQAQPDAEKAAAEQKARWARQVNEGGLTQQKREKVEAERKLRESKKDDSEYLKAEETRIASEAKAVAEIDKKNKVAADVAVAAQKAVTDEKNRQALAFQNDQLRYKLGQTDGVKEQVEAAKKFEHLKNGSGLKRFEHAEQTHDVTTKAKKPGFFVWNGTRLVEDQRHSAETKVAPAPKV